MIKTSPSKRSIALFLLTALAVAKFSAVAMAGDAPHPAEPPAPPPVFFIEDDLPLLHWRGDGKEAFLGVAPVDLTEELCRYFGAETEGAVMVGRVEEGSPAAEAGLEVGDILLAVDGKPVKSGLQLRTQVLKKKAGDELRLEVLRDGRSLELEAVVDERQRKGWAWRFLEAPQKAEQEDAARKALGEITARFGNGRWLEELKELEAVRKGELRKRIDQLEKKLEELARQMEKDSR